MDRPLSTELFPLNEAGEASAVLSVAGNRNKLEQLLGVGNGAFADLQTGLAILDPLLAKRSRRVPIPPIARLERALASAALVSSTPSDRSNWPRD